MKIEVVSKDMGAWGNGAKTQVVRKYSPACTKTKLQRMHL
jgi:hypothetical protein